MLQDTQKMNKKGTLLLKELVYLIVSVIALIAIISKGYPALKRVIYNEPDKYSINNYERLVQEIESFMNYYDEVISKKDVSEQNYQRVIPINLDEKLGLVFFNPDDEKPRSCKRDKSCVCLVYKKDYNPDKNYRVFKCKSFKKKFNFDVDYSNFDSNNGEKNRLLSGIGIGSYKLYVSVPGVIGIARHFKQSKEFSDFSKEFDIVNKVESLYIDGSSDFKEIKPDTIVMHFSVTRNADETVEVLKQRYLSGDKASAHFAIDRDGTIIQMVPTNKRAYHAGCTADSSPGILRSRWEEGRLLCNDFSIQNPKFVRNFFQGINNHAIGIELTALVSSSKECPKGWLKTQGLNYYTGDLWIYKPDDKVYCWQPFTNAEYESAAKLVAKLVKKYNIYLDYDHIIGHDRITYDKIDPGANFDWPRFMCLVKTELEVLNSRNDDNVYTKCDEFNIEKIACDLESDCKKFVKKNLKEELQVS